MIEDKPIRTYRLNYCKVCSQITNHLNEQVDGEWVLVCQKHKE